MNNTSIRDNHKNGSVGQFLIDNVKQGAGLSIVSAYFTIYAYKQLKNQLDQIDHLKFLFGEPTFIKSLDPAKTNRRDFKIEDDKLVIPIESRLKQKSISKECSDWMKEKVSVKSMVKPNFLHGKLYLMENPNGVKEAVMGSSNFTVHGLGMGGSPNIELNMVIQDRRDLDDLKNWFNALWNDTTGLVEDVKAEVLMLSATPVNNNLRDLRNQISLITEGKNDALFESTHIKDITLTLKNAQTQFTLWADPKKNPERTAGQPHEIKKNLSSNCHCKTATGKRNIAF